MRRSQSVLVARRCQELSSEWVGTKELGQWVVELRLSTWGAGAPLVEQALHDAGFTEVGVPWRSGTGAMVAAVR